MSALTLSSRVTAVTVFRRGAMVTRAATLERGDDGFPGTVRVEGLPLLLDDGSLRVAVEAEGEGAAPLARDARVTLAVPEPDPDLRPPTNEELDAARLALAKAQVRQTDLETELSQVGALAPGDRGVPEDGSPPIASPTEARLTLLAFRRERLEALSTRLSEAVEAVRLAKEHLSTLLERERKASSARNPRTFEARKAVVVGLSGPRDHPTDRVTLVLRYFVHGARWAPSYVLRLEPGLDGGVLELRALVGQATTERWLGVALTLSTANPQQWTELPELRSMRIGRQQPAPARTGWRPPPSGSDLLYADFDRELAAPPVQPPPPPPSAAPVSGGAAPMTQTGVLKGFGAAEMARMEDIAADATAHFALSEQGPRGGVAKAKKRASGAPPRARAAAVAPQGMPMPMAPPAAAPMQAPGAAPMPSRAAPDALVSSRARRADEPDFDDDEVAFDGYGGGGGGLEEPPASAAATLTADRSLLEYGSLRVPSPQEPNRGELSRCSPAESYGQLSSLPAEQIAAALSHGQRARHTAMQLESRSAPGEHRWAHSVDGFDYAYVAQASVDLDSDGELRSLPLSAPAVETKARFISVPRETQDVFRVVVVRNPLEAPLLPGPVDVYVGGRFALATELEQTPPRGRVELGLGVEQAIKIARNVAFDDEASGRILKRHRELEHRIEVEIANHLPSTATIEVRERVPVIDEDEDDIQITERTVDPAWHELTQDDPPLEGGRKWTVDVGAGSTRTLRAEWSIRIPQSHEIIGGNRREG